jgi:hypothetical protein
MRDCHELIFLSCLPDILAWHPLIYSSLARPQKALRAANWHHGNIPIIPRAFIIMTTV